MSINMFDGSKTLPTLFTSENEIPFTDDNGILSSWVKPRRPVRIAIVETGGTHDEVIASLIYAFGGHPDAELQLYLAKQRYGMDEIVSNFSLQSPIMSIGKPAAFNGSVYTQAPDVLLSTTCEFDLISRHMQEPLAYLLSNTTTHLFCLIHHADRWVEGKHVDMLQKWVDRGRIDIIALSQHTADFLVKKTIPKWSSNAGSNVIAQPVLARTLPPVFPMNLADLDSTDDGNLRLAMQGNYEPGRRDYKGIFRDLSEMVYKAAGGASATADSKYNITLHLVGHGEEQEVPKDIEANVVFNSDLSYLDFYNLMSRAFSILPAFGSETYYYCKASSSIPAALIAGVPLVANEKLLAAYSYFPREAAWVAEGDERELAVVQRVINQHDEYLKKKAAAKAACRRLMEENRANVKKWIEAAMNKALIT
ncbi:hypothetical protein BGZ63DRAFT_435505 [Mariannaea sp. PMI_226]|nr:hypothetical protein BGZ63DRAFT_435505 [Mariannaea sp. PMI_226]